MVRVRFFSKFRLLLRTDCIELEAGRVDELLTKISAHYEGIEIEELRNSLIFVNGTSISELKLYKTPIKNGDEVVLFSPVAGG